VFSLPNILTWLRILAIPFLVLVYWWPSAWMPATMPIGTGTRNILACAIFSAAAVTDWFDGYLARKMNLMSPFGAFLDPVADKLLVCAALLVLLDMGRVNSLVAMIIIGREITISALREWMAEVGERKKVAVSVIGKYKTGFQMVAIPMLLYNGIWFGKVNFNTIGHWLIWIAAALTVWSMLVYLRQAWPILKAKS
jgi:cardiolipin synthase (CMP-forming)